MRTSILSLLLAVAAGECTASPAVVPADGGAPAVLASCEEAAYGADEGELCEGFGLCAVQGDTQCEPVLSPGCVDGRIEDRFATACGVVEPPDTIRSSADLRELAGAPTGRAALTVRVRWASGAGAGAPVSGCAERTGGEPGAIVWTITDASGAAVVLTEPEATSGCVDSKTFYWISAGSYHLEVVAGDWTGECDVIAGDDGSIMSDAVDDCAMQLP